MADLVGQRQALSVTETEVTSGLVCVTVTVEWQPQAGELCSPAADVPALGIGIAMARLTPEDRRVALLVDVRSSIVKYVRKQVGKCY